MMLTSEILTIMIPTREIRTKRIPMGRLMLIA